MKLIILFLSIVLLFFIDFYVLKAIKYVFSFSIYKTILFNLIYWLPLVVISVATIYGVYLLKETNRTLYFSVLLTSIVLLYIPKLNIVSFYFIEFLISFIFGNSIIINKLGMLLFLLSLIFILHGITINKAMSFS